MNAARRRCGFSLVEVALALGLIAFALTAVFGLLTVGVNGGKASQEDTVLATMTNEIVSELRQQSFAPSPSASPASQPTPPSLPGTEPATPLGAGAPGNPQTLPVMYFDDSGARLRDYSGSVPQDFASSAAAVQAGAIFQCTATLLSDRLTAADGGTLGKPDTTTGHGQINLVKVTLVFRWPVAAASNATPSSTTPQNGYSSIQISLARY